MKTLNDMFFNLTNPYGNERAELNFPNGYGASVLRGDYQGKKSGDLYEVAVLKGVDLCFETYLTDTTLSYQTEQQVNDCLNAIQQLDEV
jgi:hypothetical protein